MAFSKRGFTLIESLVAVLITGVAVVAVVQGFGRMLMTEARMIEMEKVQRLTQDKLDEIVGAKDFNTLEGSFEDRGVDGFEWEAALETTGVENLEQLRVTVRTTNSPRQITRSLYTLVYRPPETSTTTTGARP